MSSGFMHRLFGAVSFTLVLSYGVASAQEPYVPVTLENCGRKLTFTKAPERAVIIGQSTTEILYLLDLADHVAGTALWVSPVLEGFEEVNAKIERLADNDPSFESVIAKKPDLVATQFQWQVGPEGVVATPEQFEELGIPVYTSPADCVGKDNSGGGDGARTAKFTMDLVYQEIDDLARIFGVEERGHELIDTIRQREADAKARLAALSKDVLAVFWFSSAEVDIDPYVAGQSGAPGYIMSTLDVTNVIESEEEWPTVGWETIARANPTVIVMGKMDRRRYPADDVEVKKQFLHADPVTSTMAAVQENRVFEMDAQAMNPTIRTIQGMEALADALIKAGLGK